MASNPVFNEKTLKNLTLAGVTDESRTMTIHGSVNKASLLMLLMIATSVVGWQIADTELGMMLAIGAIVVNLVLAIVLAFKRQLSPTLAPVYALVEGFAIGAISQWTDRAFPGVALNAMVLTTSCFALMLVLYRTRIIVVTETFKAVVMAATAAIAVTYVINLVMMAFGSSIPMIHETGIYGIGFSVVVVGVAAMNLLLDFDMIEKAAAMKAPKYMEWYAGFALLVTIVWLYLEMLRLLSKLSKK